MTNLSLAAAFILLLIAVFHLLWGFDIYWPAADETSLARAVVGAQGITQMPNLFACSFVTVALLIGTGIVLRLGGVLELSAVPLWLFQLAGAGFAFVLLARGIVGSNPVEGVRRRRGERAGGVIGGRQRIAVAVGLEDPVAVKILGDDAVGPVTATTDESTPFAFIVVGFRAFAVVKGCGLKLDLAGPGVLDERTTDGEVGETTRIIVIKENATITAVTAGIGRVVELHHGDVVVGEVGVVEAQQRHVGLSGNIVGAINIVGEVDVVVRRCRRRGHTRKREEARQHRE